MLAAVTHRGQRGGTSREHPEAYIRGAMNEAVTYGKYLKIEELLGLQQPRGEVEHDEMLFIVIHQVGLSTP